MMFMHELSINFFLKNVTRLHQVKNIRTWLLCRRLSICSVEDNKHLHTITILFRLFRPWSFKTYLCRCILALDQFHFKSKLSKLPHSDLWEKPVGWAEGVALFPVYTSQPPSQPASRPPIFFSNCFVGTQIFTPTPNQPQPLLNTT